MKFNETDKVGFRNRINKHIFSKKKTITDKTRIKENYKHYAYTIQTFGVIIEDRSRYLSRFAFNPAPSTVYNYKRVELTEMRGFL